jgi:ribosomal protein L20
VGSQREKGVRGEVAAEVDNAKQELTRAGAADCNAYRNRANRRNDVRSGISPG